MPENNGPKFRLLTKLLGLQPPPLPLTELIIYEMAPYIFVISFLTIRTQSGKGYKSGLKWQLYSPNCCRRKSWHCFLFKLD